jgi:hypothetical protein
MSSPPVQVGQEQVIDSTVHGAGEPGESQASKRRRGGKQATGIRKPASSGLSVSSYCSSSMAAVSGLFSKFDSEKRALVDEIEFGGMLRLPMHTEPNAQHCLWLMRNVETSEHAGLFLHTRNLHGILCRDVSAY